MAQIFVHNCETGDASIRDMTTEEEARRATDAAEAETERTGRQAAADQRVADLALLAESDDPRHQAMARLLS